MLILKLQKTTHKKEGESWWTSARKSGVVHYFFREKARDGAGTSKILGSEMDIARDGVHNTGIKDRNGLRESWIVRNNKRLRAEHRHGQTRLQLLRDGMNNVTRRESESKV